MERIARMENDLLREKEEIEKMKHDNEKLKEGMTQQERRNKVAEEK